MKILTNDEVQSLLNHPKHYTQAESDKITAEWPRCFVCGGLANGTNRTRDMWTCGPHWATSLDEALEMKGIATDE